MDLPEELRFSNMSKPHDAILYSNKIQPVSFSQQQVRFEVSKQGIMASNAIVEWAFKPSPTGGASTDWAYFPLNIGCQAQIARAVLSTQSGRIILDNKNFAQRQTCEASFREGAYNHFVSPYLNLSYNSFHYTTNLEDAAVAGDLRLSGVPVDSNNVPSPSGAAWTPPAIINLMRTGHGGLTDETAVQCRVSLQELFPFLYEHNLPVNLMETMYIDIYWRDSATEGDVYQMAEGQGGTTWGGTILQSACYLLSDNIVYTSPLVMDSIRAHQEARGGLNFEYVDYHTQIVATADQAAASEQAYERDLGCNNYLVTCIKNIELKGIGGLTSSFFGKYYSDGQLSRHLQFTLNDQLLFPDNLANQMENYYRLSQVYAGEKPYVPRGAFALDTTIATQAVPATADENYLGKDMSVVAGIGGSLNTLGVNLTDAAGQAFRVGNTPIRLYYQKDATITGQTFTQGSLQYYFVEYMRNFVVTPSGKIVVADFI